MDIAKLKALSDEHQESGLYRGSFECLSVSVHRQVEYANNVLLVESELEIGCEALIIYSVFEEATHCLYWTQEQALEFIRKTPGAVFPAADFRGLYATHFRGSPIFEKIGAAEIESVISLSDPAYDDWCGEFLVRTKSRQFVLMWDYCD